MMHFILFCIFGLLLVLLIIANVLFRARLLRLHGELVKKGVHFEGKHLFSASRLESEVVPKYPEAAPSIRAFRAELLRAARTMGLLFALLLAISCGLLFFAR
jgi:hypothetical protein